VIFCVSIIISVINGVPRLLGLSHEEKLVKHQQGENHVEK